METVVTTKKLSPADGKAKRSQGGGSRSGGPTAPAHKALITRNLRIAYDEVAGEAIPPEMLKLLNQLDARESAPEEEG